MAINMGRSISAWRSSPRPVNYTSYRTYELVNHVLFCGSDRPKDRYIEIHIFDEVSWQSLSKVALEKPLTTSDEQDDWKFGRMKLAHRGVAIVDKVNP